MDGIFAEFVSFVVFVEVCEDVTENELSPNNPRTSSFVFFCFLGAVIEEKISTPLLLLDCFKDVG